MKTLPITARMASEMDVTDSKTTNPLLLAGRWTLDIIHCSMSKSLGRNKNC